MRGLLKDLHPAQHDPARLDESTVEHLAAPRRRRHIELADAAGVRIGQGTVMHRLITHMWAGVKAPAGQGDVLLDGPPCHGFDAHANRAP